MAAVDRLLPVHSSRAARYALVVLLALSGAGLLLLAWGLVEPYLVEWRRVRAPIKHLPPPWHGRRIAAFGDVQVGALLANTTTTRRVVAHLVEEKPEAVLLLGDLIYNGAGHAPERVQEAVDLVAPLARAGIPVYAVLGNHDYHVTERDPQGDHRRAAGLARALEAAGIRVLHNEAVPLTLDRESNGHDNRIATEKAGTELYIVGLGCHAADEDDPLNTDRRGKRMNDNAGKVGGLLVGFLIGAIVGAIVALLNAPRSGPQTREKLQERALELRDKAQDTMSEAQSRVGDVSNRIVDRASQLQKEGEQALRRGQRRVEEAARDVRDTAGDIQL